MGCEARTPRPSPHLVRLQRQARKRFVQEQLVLQDPLQGGMQGPERRVHRTPRVIMISPKYFMSLGANEVFPRGYGGVRDLVVFEDLFGAELGADEG